MASPLRKFLLKSSLGDVIVRREMRRAKSDSTTKMQIVIRSFESIDKNLYWELPPNTRKIGLPSSRSLFTVLKSPHVHKKAREQFEMKINKEMLVMETKRDELRKKFFWLKRQRIFGAQFEILFSFKTRFDKEKLQKILQPGSKDVPEHNAMLRSIPVPARKDRVEDGSKAPSAPLIENLVFDKSHRPIVESQPDPEKGSQYEAVERANLENHKESMAEKDIAELAHLTHQLQLKQETLDLPEAVPSSTL